MNTIRTTRAALLAATLMLPLAALSQAQPDQDRPAASDPPAAATSPDADGKVARVNDFPTQTRVELVLSCIEDHPDRPPQEMFYKCVCAADAIAARVSHERWLELSVFNDARPIAGERGAYLRERRDAPALMRAYRELRASADKSCFIRPSGN